VVRNNSFGPMFRLCWLVEPELSTCGRRPHTICRSRVVASDFFVAVTATFRILYVFAVLEVGTRRILHRNVTAHPTADWTARQFRMIVSGDQPHRFVIHDRDTILWGALIRSV